MKSKDLEKIKNDKWVNVQKMDCDTIGDFVKSAKRRPKYRGLGQFIEKELYNKKCKKTQKAKK